MEIALDEFVHMIAEKKRPYLIVEFVAYKKNMEALRRGMARLRERITFDGWDCIG